VTCIHHEVRRVFIYYICQVFPQFNTSLFIPKLAVLNNHLFKHKTGSLTDMKIYPFILIEKFTYMLDNLYCVLRNTHCVKVSITKCGGSDIPLYRT
jgi:uncharacterized membrane protein